MNTFANKTATKKLQTSCQIKFVRIICNVIIIMMAVQGIALHCHFDDIIIVYYIPKAEKISYLAILIK